ncbi:uncharacterized protein UBRO_21030 [Ustilago bromivora]|uniref:CCHC-type domain-containing protein n=1 Tax=Ustilago bromivora TaxID=307758 RepID=A0A1K0FVF6_9BASI|nr:uncharacterized protein UBRO_21030 [Ustilago bromivora]
MEAYNKLLALCLTSNTPGATTCHVEQFRDLEGQVNLDDNELIIDLFRGSLTRSLQGKFEYNPPVKRWEWYREVEEIDRQWMLLQQSAARHPNAGAPHINPSIWSTPTTQGAAPNRPLVPMTLGNPSRPNNQFLPHQMAQGLRKRGPTNASNSACHLCKGTGHWARDCPNKKLSDPMTPQPMGPKVMVTTEDLLEEGAPDSGDEQTVDPEAVNPDDLDFSKGKAVLELTGTVQEHPAHILANTSTGLSIVSEPFVSKYQITTKPTKPRLIHGVTGHQLAINSSATIQVTIGKYNLGVVEALVADTANYELILGYSELRRLKPTICWDMGQLEFEAQGQEGNKEGTEAATRSSWNWGYKHEVSRTCQSHGVTTKFNEKDHNIEKPKHPKVHGNEFILAECLIQAALEDGPIGFMLLDTPPSLLPTFGFVPT